MTALQFTIIGRPQQRGSKTPYQWKAKDGRSGIAMMDANKNSEAWMQAVRNAAARAMGDQELWRGPITLSAEFRFSRPKSHYRTGKYAGEVAASAPKHHTQTPDLGKLIRTIEDAMSGVVYHDDRQIRTYLAMDKSWTTKSEGCTIWVTNEKE